METFKSEAARRQVVRIQSALCYPQFNFEQVIKKIRWREEDIKRCYDKGTPLRGEVLLWMVARDACFILEFFRNHLSGLQDDDIFCRYDYVFRPMYHPIFGPQSENPGVKSAIMKDLIKLDNQIPLFILHDVLDMEMRDSRSSDGGQSSCFGCAPQQSENLQNPSQSKEWRVKVPSAVQLKNGGVKFKANGKNVVDIRFQGKTLTLPSLKLDVDSEIYIGNLVALENSSPYYKSKSMTSYIKFMYELCKTEKGVDVMREEGVLAGNLWQHSDAVRVFSLCKQSPLSRSQDLFEKTRRKLIKYCNRKFWTAAEILWNEFCNAYGSKPWLVVEASEQPLSSVLL
ncbi:hypothetical protein SUGI_0570190 [Cryptomeria japonica]|nr:hypothetical protein SUGI_0570190 [Cryptomeria japonica]